MTESSPVLPPPVHVRPTSRRLAFLAATMSFVASVSAGYAFLTSESLVWERNLFAAAFWALPLALVMLVSFTLTLDRLPADSPVRQLNVVAPAGVLLGIAWAFVVFLTLDGRIDGAFRPLVTWVAAGVYAMIYVVSPPDKHRIWAAPLLVATVLGAALIGLGAFTNQV